MDAQLERYPKLVYGGDPREIIPVTNNSGGLKTLPPRCSNWRVADVYRLISNALFMPLRMTPLYRSGACPSDAPEPGLLS